MKKVKVTILDGDKCVSTEVDRELLKTQQWASDVVQALLRKIDELRAK